jgi:type I restriction enzyme S subunit
MKSWKQVALSEVADVSAGDPAPQAADDFAPDGFPFVRMQDVGRYGRTTNLTETKDSLAPDVSRKMKVFPKGSILVPKSGASIRLNHRAILGMDANIVSHLAVITTKPPLDNRFAYYWLCTLDLSSVAHDANLPSMKTSDLARLGIPLPPLSEQKRIVRILDEAEELRRLRTEADRRTANLIPAIFYDMFGDPVYIERMSWPRHRVDSFAEVSYGLADKLDTSTMVSQGTRIITISNVTLNGSLDLSVERYSTADSAKRAKARMSEFDLLFNWRNGSEEHVGKTAIWEGPFPGEVLHVSFLLRIRPDRSSVEPYYLWVLLNMMRASGFFTRESRMQINRKYNASELSALLLPLPPLPLQSTFAARVAEVRAMEAEQAQSRRRLDDLFQSLLHEAFSGGPWLCRRCSVFLRRVQF